MVTLDVGDGMAKETGALCMMRAGRPGGTKESRGKKRNNEEEEVTEPRVKELGKATGTRRPGRG